MCELIVMVGLQGSGKSTIAEELKDGLENCEIVSSDQIRKEYNHQITNDKVFKIYYERARKFLEEGKSVILDATNITMKSRRQVFEQLKGIDCTKCCYIVNTPVNICADRLIERNKTNEQEEVPLEVLYKYLKSFEMPFMEEGWDEIIIHDLDLFNIVQYAYTIDDMEGFDQKNHHHKYTLGEHCRLLENYLRDYGFPKDTGTFHDVGKMFTQTMGEDGNAHYLQHHNVGAYFLLSHPYLIETQDYLDLLFYVNYHMQMFNLQTDKAREKWRSRFGGHKFEMLEILHKGDKIASGTYDSETL